MPATGTPVACNEPTHASCAFEAPGNTPESKK